MERQGLIGVVQINGRNAFTSEEKFVLNGWCSENRNLWFDTKILCMTAPKVVRRDGIIVANNMSMPVFTGSKGSGASD